ncbi:Hypothetical predicted protein [Scomber scombrus]|uniref:Uncharacterized protein n=1 Tax=Scomber scombrus TaxID=13677 RepID=A0AAV1NUD4_SCOSC
MLRKSKDYSCPCFRPLNKTNCRWARYNYSKGDELFAVVDYASEYNDFVLAVLQSDWMKGIQSTAVVHPPSARSYTAYASSQLLDKCPQYAQLIIITLMSYKSVFKTELQHDYDSRKKDGYFLLCYFWYVVMKAPFDFTTESITSMLLDMVR